MSTANVFYFNPTCELAVANGSFSYVPPSLLRRFEHDCSALPFGFAKAGDFVVTEKKPSGEFMMKLADVGFEMPEFCALSELISGNIGSFNSIFPWGWSPAAHFILKDLKEKCSPQFKANPVFNWTNEHRALFERATSLRFLNDFLAMNPSDIYIERELTGEIVKTTAEIEDLLRRKMPLVLKAPLSSSGRGIQVIRKSMLNNSNRQWISGILKQQKYLVAEPFLEKIVDFSFQYKINSGGEPEYLGYSVFETNTNGQYLSTFIHSKIEDFETSGITLEIETMIEITAARLRHMLINSGYTTLHRGFLGIDAMIYRDNEGLKIQPCIEINSRMTMGVVAMQIERRIHRQATGLFKLFYGPPGEFRKFAIEKVRSQPLKFKDGKIVSGFLPIVDPGPEMQFGAYFIAETAR